MTALPESNPYRPPESDASASVPVSVDQNPHRKIIGIVAGVLSFLCVGFVVWVGILLVFFADSSDTWPGFAALIPALICGVPVFRIVRRSASPILLTVSIFPTSFLVMLAVVGLSGGTFRFLFPSNANGVWGLHWFFFCLAGLSVTACTYASRLHRRRYRIGDWTLIMLCVLLSGAYLAWWIRGCLGLLA